MNISTIGIMRTCKTYQVYIEIQTADLSIHIDITSFSKSNYQVQKSQIPFFLMLPWPWYVIIITANSYFDNFQNFTHFVFHNQIEETVQITFKWKYKTKAHLKQGISTSIKLSQIN